MLMDKANNDINKNETKPILLIEGPPAADPLLNRFMKLKVDDSIQQDLNLDNQGHFETDSTTTIFGSIFSNDSQLKRPTSESDEENLNKSVSDLKKKCLEDERKWLRYKIDSVTKEQAIIFCILGQLLLTQEDIKGSRKEIPLPEEAKQILLFMTYGDHWLLRDLSYVLGYVDKVNLKMSKKKWKGLLDYYRNEFRKTQEERSGEGADTVYKPNWPYFMSLDFLRAQYTARPSYGKISKQRGRRKADVHGLEVGDINSYYPNNSQDNLQDKNSATDELLIENIDEVPSICTNNQESRAFIHPNDFLAENYGKEQIQNLVQLEEKNVAMLEEKKGNRDRGKELNENNDNEDLKYFESLMSDTKLITGVNKLMFRNEVQSLVMKYAYNCGELESSSRCMEWK